MKFFSKSSAITFSKSVASISLIVFLSNLLFSYGQELVSFDTGYKIGDEFCRDVAISGDGKVMVIGAPFGDPNGLYTAGYVKLYEKSGSDWDIMQQINGTLTEGKFGYSVALSKDASILTIVSYHVAVHMYEYSTESKQYELIDSKEYYAGEVAVSPDGMVVGIAAGNSTSEEPNYSGARIFERSGTGFQQRGSDFSEYGRFYSGIDLNYDGSVVIIGDRTWSSGRGRVGVFQWKENGESMDWIQMGNDFVGDADGDWMGYLGCVSITHDGMTVTVGAYKYDGTKGLVRVYDYDESEEMWNKFGGDLTGDYSDDYFSANVLSNDGMYLAVGAWNKNYVEVFEKGVSDYVVSGNKVIGEGGGWFGGTVDITDDGSVVAIGDFWYPFHKNAGKAYLYFTGASTSTPFSVGDRSFNYDVGAESAS